MCEKKKEGPMSGGKPTPASRVGIREEIGEHGEKRK